MTNAFFDRYSKLILVLAAAVMLPAAYASFQVLERNHNRVEDWLPRHLAETEEYVWFLEQFQGDELLVVAWPGCTVDDGRLDRLTASAAQLRDSQGLPLFRRVLSGRSVLGSLTSEPVNLSRDLALERMRSWLVGPDGKSTCAVFMVDSLRSPDRHAAVAAVSEIARDECGIPAADLKVGGPTADSVFIDRASTDSLYVLSLTSILLGLVISWTFLRSGLLVLAVFATSLLCEFCSLALVYVAGTNVDAVLIMMPALVYILAICGCIHFLNCYREALAESGPTAAPTAALRFAWRPTVMASVMTAIGLTSLAVSDLLPVRRFGLFAAIGVLLSTAILFLFLPALLTRLGRRLATRHADSPFRAEGVWETAVARLAIDHRRVVLTVCLVVMAVTACGAPRIRTSAKIRDFFADDSYVLDTYRWFERHVGPIIPIDIVLRVKQGGTLTTLERMELAGAVRDEVAGMPHLGGVTSAATFAPPIAAGGGGARGTTQRTVMNRLVERHRGALVEHAYLADAPGEELWLISGRAAAFADVDYGALLGDLEQRVNRVVHDRLRNRGQDVKVVVCGGIPLINLVQERLLRDLAASFGATIAMIGVLMAVALRSVRAAAILLIPNVFPTALVFGLMGWLGVTVDLGSMMTISTALGISVDNELHFIAWYRHAMLRGLSRREALLATFRHCGGPMVQTAFICGLGMSVFSLSGFLPTARFGWLMCVLIWSAAVCDLVLLPALLASPAGRFFATPARPINAPHFSTAEAPVEVSA